MRPTLAASSFALALVLSSCGDGDDASFVPCSDPADCEAGYACIENPESQIGVCAETCAQGCQAGYVCGGAGGTECVLSGGS